VSKGPDEPVGPKAVGKAELFGRIVESATDFAIFAMDPSGLVTSWNAGAERLFGYAEGEIVGRSADLIFTPEDRAMDAPEDERRHARVDGRAEDERWHLRKDGSRFWASGLLMPLGDSAAGFVKITRDRTERHRVEKRLCESEGRFRLLATSIPQLVFSSRPDGARTWGSPQWVSFTGLPLEESLGLGWLDAVHPDDREVTLRRWAEGQASGEYYVEHRVRRGADGGYRWHQTRARPLEAGNGMDGGEWIGTMTDVHDLRSTQDQQRVLVAELQHRTRNLLAVVQSIASQTLRTSASLEEFGEEFDSRLGALSRVQGLLARADREAVDLRTLIEMELEAHGDGGADPGKVRVEGPPVALPAGSAQTLALALHELATNAIKYGALKQLAGRLAVTWAVEGDGRRVLLEWRETGVLSVAEDTLPRRKGYGSELIERALPYQLGAETRLEFGVDGVHCAIVVPVEAGREEARHG
jgi:PAS domain S-box-containing protein